MQDKAKPKLGVCAVCEEVFEIDGELPVCENCLTRLDRWVPEEAEAEPLLAGV
jgi:hypothetical protein